MELVGKAKLVFEACAKISEGEVMIKKGHDLISEGKIELVNILGEAKAAIPGEVRPRKSKSTFRKERRNNEEISNLIVSTVKKNGPSSTSDLKGHFNIGDRRMALILETLVKQNRLHDQGSGMRHYWAVPPQHDKAIPSRGKHSRSLVDEKDYVEPALAFLRTNEWVTKGKLLDHLHISQKPGNRLFEYLEKQRLVRQVTKKNNPEHSQSKHLFNQDFNYWEAMA